MEIGSTLVFIITAIVVIIITYNSTVELKNSQEAYPS